MEKSYIAWRREMEFNTGDVVRVTKDCDGSGYPTFVGEVG
jgi:hypothetical protein